MENPKSWKLEAGLGKWVKIFPLWHLYHKKSCWPMSSIIKVENKKQIRGGMLAVSTHFRQGKWWARWWGNSVHYTVSLHWTLDIFSMTLQTEEAERTDSQGICSTEQGTVTSKDLQTGGSLSTTWFHSRKHKENERLPSRLTGTLWD